ncbi:dockerin type I domain-containing protein [Anaerobium acetethylicum]|uniref:Beta-N-acetylglucosaminidase n=1 Tax=Anaerobium acetethylicum TaxID=1619234 RepID=A0A1D3TZ46_9FIRM|nr:dockerin type I domain-containing protein [Anaerobium acetethylicum]SCP99798.1 Beta-N-acetylglucosaminidase [Anaerobium acetethylicum]
MKTVIRTKLKHIFVVAAFVGILSAGIYIFNTVSEAYTEQSGTVTSISGGAVNVRSGAGTTFEKVAAAPFGQAVTVIDETTASDGYKWYNIKYNSVTGTITGWMRSDYILITPVSGDPSTDADFEAYLNAQGFPESYRVYLRDLHAKHPNWVFRAQNTGLDWNTVINEESKLGTNLVSSSSPSSWKSTQDGAYNWDTGKWIGMDTSNWVAASEGIVKYFMDPRNFLVDGSSILQFESLSFANTQNKTGIANILSGSFMATDNYYRIFYEAGFDNNISPYHLASRSLQEVGYNGSGSSSGTYSGYEGFYNFFNIGSTPNADGSGALVNGLIRAKKEGWTSPELSIKGGAKFVGNNYIYKGQNTLYYQKFNVVYSGGYGLYRHQYMTNIQAPTSESTKMKKAYTDFNASAITFIIPVYKNMPDIAAEKPTKDGSPNNVLASLVVDGYSLTPYFEKFTEDYSLIVPSDVNSVQIGATAVATSGASIKGVGVKELQPGENKIDIQCTAENGDVRNYTITIIRTVEEINPGAEGENDPDGEDDTADNFVIESNYKIDEFISGIEPGTSSEQLILNIKVAGYNVKVTDSSNAIKTGKIMTGDSVQIYKDNVLVKEYPVVIYGDVTGDGNIDSLDLLYIKRHTLNIKALSGIYVNAADTNKSNDGIINGLDLLYIKRHVLDIKKIVQ